MKAPLRKNNEHFVVVVVVVVEFQSFVFHFSHPNDSLSFRNLNSSLYADMLLGYVWPHPQLQRRVCSFKQVLKSSPLSSFLSQDDWFRH